MKTSAITPDVFAGMSVAFERITPESAAAMLATSQGNRKFRVTAAAKYAKDMGAGNWTMCTDSIAFYSNGALANGHHRLTGVVNSGTTQTFIVFRGLPLSAALNQDRGMPRTLIDNAHMSGRDPTLTTNLVSAAKAIAYGTKQKKVSDADVIDIIEEHREAAEFAVRSLGSAKRIVNGMVMGAIGRAWYYEDDKDKLRRFCEVIARGYYTGERESAAVTMRNYLLNKNGLDTYVTWPETFRKVQNCIRYFMMGRPLTILRNIDNDTYPLPSHDLVEMAQEPDSEPIPIPVRKSMRASRRQSLPTP